MKTTWFLPLVVLLMAVLFILLFLHNFYLPRKMNYKPGKSGDDREDPTDWMCMQRIYPNGSFDYNHYLWSLQQARALHNTSSRDFYWVPAGPYNIRGRFTDVANRPSQPQVVYVGAATSGIYQSVIRCLWVTIKGWQSNLYTQRSGDMNLYRFAF
ncbi:MAG: hypothetical protein PWR20_357 [Bacteroidales bacterium]|jgi:hypothetical protein|nr:hypothetical protein [Bacteroidales bacterium]MDN5330042.1 hypothetical protein [Bacteroidales bacterium]NLH53633.1 hypothetical protein [Bacteroidales bacterium]NPV35553.1 hypothetical protein [Bacteroidales bacterium]